MIFVRFFFVGPWWCFFCPWLVLQAPRCTGRRGQPLRPALARPDRPALTFFVPSLPLPVAITPVLPTGTQLATAASMRRVKSELRIRGDRRTLDWLDRFSDRELGQRLVTTRLFSPCLIIALNSPHFGMKCTGRVDPLFDTIWYG